jgi:hypothetical protein
MRLSLLGDLLRRMPVPIFFKSATHSIALHNAIGDSNIIRMIRGTLALSSWDARPGKSVQVSIQDNQWVTLETVTLQNMARLEQFWQDLFTDVTH